MAHTKNVEFGYAVEIPAATSTGVPVNVMSGERDGIHMLHVESEDKQEVYFEITAYPECLDHQSFAEDQQGFLRKNASEETLSEITTGEVEGHEGVTFHFSGHLQGMWKERVFLFIDANRTYRVVHDPRSDTNKTIMQSLVLGLVD